MILPSVVSYKKRGPYGKWNYRGNTTGYLIKDLLKYFKPKKVVDFMVGGGTTKDVCEDLGINYFVTDLNPKWGGFNALKDEIPESSDFIFWHPPYHDIVKYSGIHEETSDWHGMWGEKPHPDDLSRCRSYEDFIKKINKIQVKALSSLRKGGRLAILVGEAKKKGKFMPIQKDMNWYGEPEAHIIKVQHNCMSDQKKYKGKFIKTAHEHVLIFKKEDCYIIPVRMVKRIGADIRNSTKITWRDVVLAAMQKLGGEATLKELYREIKGHKKTSTNNHWRAKIRQTVQNYPDFMQVGKGRYTLVELSKVA